MIFGRFRDDPAAVALPDHFEHRSAAFADRRGSLSRLLAFSDPLLSAPTFAGADEPEHDHRFVAFGSARSGNPHTESDPPGVGNVEGFCGLAGLEFHAEVRFQTLIVLRLKEFAPGGAVVVDPIQGVVIERVVRILDLRVVIRDGNVDVRTDAKCRPEMMLSSSRSTCSSISPSSPLPLESMILPAALGIGISQES